MAYRHVPLFLFNFFLASFFCCLLFSRICVDFVQLHPFYPFSVLFYFFVDSPSISSSPSSSDFFTCWTFYSFSFVFFSFFVASSFNFSPLHLLPLL